MKKRLDRLVHERMGRYSKTQIQSWIMQGLVLVNGAPITKPGTLVADDVEIICKGKDPQYVSRAGFKLEAALSHFNIAVQGLVCLDAGISTGGFTDCLLQHGAKKVYGIDVGYGQVHEKIRTDSRVTILERTNLRELRTVGEPVDLITLDLSFISVLKVMDAVTSLLKSDGYLIVLIKPQFEAEYHQIGKKGIIKDDAVHREVVERVISGVATYGFSYKGIMESPILGSTGNKEFLAYFIKN